MLTRRIVVAMLVLLTAETLQAAVVTIQPGPADGKDTWIWASQDWSHADWGELRTNQLSAHDQRILIEFTQLSSLVPSGATVTSAVLGLYRYAAYDNSSLTLDARRITSAWVESVTWSTAPTFSGSVESSVTTSVNGWYQWDLSSLVQEWVDGSALNYGVGVYDHGSSYFQRFVSSNNVEATEPNWALPPRDPLLRPYLKVEYTSVIPEPTTLIIWSLLGTLAIGLGGWRRRR